MITHFLNPVIRGFGPKHVLGQQCLAQGARKIGVNSFAPLAVVHLLVAASWNHTSIYSGTIPASTEFYRNFVEIYFMNDFDEYVDEDNVDKLLEKAVEEVKADIEENQDKDSTIGIQAFHFKFVSIEDIYY